MVEQSDDDVVEGNGRNPEMTDTIEYNVTDQQATDGFNGMILSLEYIRQIQQLEGVLQQNLSALAKACENEPKLFDVVEELPGRFESLTNELMSIKNALEDVKAPLAHLSL